MIGVDIIDLFPRITACQVIRLVRNILGGSWSRTRTITFCSNFNFRRGPGWLNEL